VERIAEADPRTGKDAQAETDRPGAATRASAVQASPDRDAGQGGQSIGEAGGGAASGASGFKLVGMIVGIAAHSRVVSAEFGSYGAAMSIYYHFLARGRDVVYPKDMAMVIGLGTRGTQSSNAAGPSAK